MQWRTSHTIPTVSGRQVPLSPVDEQSDDDADNYHRHCEYEYDDDDGADRWAGHVAASLRQRIWNASIDRAQHGGQDQSGIDQRHRNKHATWNDAAGVDRVTGCDVTQRDVT